MFTTISVEKNLKNYLKEGDSITISLENGSVVFKDKNGNVISKEELKKIFVFL